MATKGYKADPQYSPVQRHVLDTGEDFGASTAESQALGSGFYDRATQTLAPRAAAAAAEPEFDLAVDPITGKVYTSAGELDGTTDNLFAVADAAKEGMLKPLGKIPKGKVGSSFADYIKTLDDTEHEGSIVRTGAQGILGGIGNAMEMGDLMVGTDEPNSWFSDKAEELRQGETVGQRAAKRAHFYESIPALTSNLAEFGGNVIAGAGGAAAGALGGAAIAGPAGVAPGALAGGMTAGGLMTGGETGKAAYNATMQALKKMPPEQLAQLEEFQLLQAENPELPPNEIARMLATEAGHAAMAPGAALGAGEALVAGKLGGAILRKLGINKLLGLGGKPPTAGSKALAMLQQNAKPISMTEKVLKATGRGSVVSAGEIGVELTQEGLPAAMAAERTGIGSTNPLDYFSWETAESVGPGAFLMGAFSGGGGPSREQIIQNSPIGEALSGQLMPRQALLTDERGAGPNLLRIGEEIEGEFEDVTPLRRDRQLSQRPQGLLSNIPHRDDVADRRDAIAAQAAEIQQREAPFQRNLFMQEPPQPEPGQGMGWNVPPQTQQGGVEQDYGVDPYQEFQLPGLDPAEEEANAVRQYYGIDLNQPQLPGTELAQNAPEGPMPEMPEGAAPPQGPVEPGRGIASEPRGEQQAPGLAERRAYQQLQGEEAPVATSPAGQQLALPAPAGSAIEAQIQDLESQRAEVVASEQEAAQYAASAGRNTKEWRAARAMLRAARQDIADLDDQIDALGEEWAAEREAAGPSGVAPGSQAPARTPVAEDAASFGELGIDTSQQVNAPAPPAAPQEAAPEGGRPAGVAPVPTVNPVPMSPGEAASRAQTQQARRGEQPAPAPTGAPIVPPAPAGAGRAAIPADEGKPTAGTPEPEADIAAQIAALKDPKSGRKAVLVPPGSTVPKGFLGKGVKRYKGTAGTLLTADEILGEKYRAGKLTDKQLGKALGAVVGREEAAKSGEPTVVEAVTPAGAVQASQVTTKGKKGEAAKAVSKQAQEGATVVETTPEAGQAKRAKETVGDKLKKKNAAKKGAKPEKSAEEQDREDIEAAGAADFAPVDEEAGVQAMITNDMRSSLRALDWTPGDILKMKPAQAANIIREQTRKEDQGARMKREMAEREVEEAKERAEQKTAEAKKKLGTKGATAAATSKKADENKSEQKQKGKKGTAQPRDTSRVEQRAAAIEERVTKAQLGTSTKPLTEAQKAEAEKLREKLVAKESQEEIAAVDNRAEPAPPNTADQLVEMSAGVPGVVVEGAKGKGVDTRTLSVDPVVEKRLNRVVENEPNSKKGKDAKKQLSLIQQFKIALSAATDAAVDRMKAKFGTKDKRRLAVATAAQMKQHKKEQEGKPGRPRETPKKSPILYMPLTVAEARGFLHAARKEAKAERKKYDPGKSVYRSMIEAMHFGVKVEQAMGDKKTAQRWIDYLADKDDVQLEQILATVHANLKHNPFAKQVMRGSAEVAHAIDRVALTAAEVNALSFGKQVGPQVTKFKGVPNKAADLVAGWITHFERGGNKFSANVRIMTMAEIIQRHPTLDFTDMDATVVTVPNREGGGVAYYDIGVDPHMFESNELAVAEALGHEFGHVVVKELYQRADQHTKALLQKAYQAFLQRKEGHFAGDVMFSEMTPFTQLYGNFESLDEFDPALIGMTPESEYVRNFEEWGARNVALYLMDPNRPVHTVMQKFWKRAADILAKVWASFTGHPQPDEAWAESVDRWIDGTLNIEPSMPATRVAWPGDPDAISDLDTLATTPNTHNVEEDDQHEDLGEFEHEYNALRSGQRKGKGDEALAGYDYEDSSTDKLNKRFVRAATKGIDGVRGLWDPSRESKTADWIKGAAHQTMSMRGMVRMLNAAKSKAAPYVEDFMRLQNKKAALAKAKQEKAAEYVRKASQLTKKQLHVYNELLAEATTYDIHPDATWESDANKHLRTGSKNEQAVNKKRWKALNDKYNALVDAEPAIEGIYKGMRDESKNVYSEQYKMREELINNTDALTEEQKKKARHANHSVFHRQQTGPHFTKKRFGDWVVTIQLPRVRIGKDGKVGGDYFATEKEAREVVKDQKSLHPDAHFTVQKQEDGWAVNMTARGVVFYDSQAEARSPKARAELLAEVKERYKDIEGGYESAQVEMKDTPIISEPSRKRKDYASSKTMGSAFGKELNDLMEEGNFPPELAAALRYLQFESLPENNFVKQLLPRNDIIGASKDMLRSYTVGMQAAANNFARLKFGRQIDDNWEKAWKAAKGDASAARVLNELKANQDQVAQRERDTIGEGAIGITSQINSVYSLGFSIPYALSNMTQPWMVATPVLGAFANGRTGKVVGQAKAMKYMKDAYADTFGFFSSRAAQETLAEWRTLMKKPQADFDEAAFHRQMIDKFAKFKDGRPDPMLQEVLEHLYDSGLLDYTFISAMSDAAKSSGGAGQWLSNVQRLSMAFPAQIEAMNRLVTAKATTNLGRDEFLIADVKDVDEMKLFVEDIVAQTQGDYSRANRARMFNKPMLGLALQFKQYMQMMYEMFAHNVMQTIRKDATPAERKQALRTLRNLMVTHAAVAGTSGLGPVSLVTKFLLWTAIQALGDEEDKWKTAEQLSTEVQKDLFGDYAGGILDQGLPGVLGWDLGDRMSFPDAVDSRFLGIKEGAKPSEGVDRYLAYAAGAPYANLKRLLDGGADLAHGRGWDASKALPSGVRGLVQSVRMGREGLVDYDGDVVIPGSELTWNDMFIKTMGGQPAKIARKFEENREVKGTHARIMAARKRIMQDARNGDIEWEDVQEFNKTVLPGFRISRSQLAQAIRAKAGRESGEVPKGEREVRKMLGY